jgi:hypothetical protein
VSFSILRFHRSLIAQFGAFLKCRVTEYDFDKTAGRFGTMTYWAFILV